MRIRFELDEELLKDAVRATLLKNLRPIVEPGLRTLFASKDQPQVQRLRGHME